MVVLEICDSGNPKHTWVRRWNQIIFRFCLAAAFAGKNAETLMGPAGHQLKAIFEKLRLSPLVFRLCIQNADRIIGIGGQSIALLSADGAYIEKFNYVVAGSDRDILKSYVEFRERELRELELHLGSIVADTRYSIERLPAIGPGGRLLTICAKQRYIRKSIDVFTPQAQAILRDPGNITVWQQLKELIENTRDLLREEFWLDIIGPENIVIDLDGPEPELAIIDTEFYEASYMDDINPVLGRSYRDVFMERLDLLENLVGQHLS